MLSTDGNNRYGIVDKPHNPGGSYPLKIRKVTVQLGYLVGFQSLFDKTFERYLIYVRPQKQLEYLRVPLSWEV